MRGNPKAFPLGGSEPKRRQWRKKRGERVAAVEIMESENRRTLFRAPQQGSQGCGGDLEGGMTKASLVQYPQGT